MTKPRLAFMGTPAFALMALQALVEAGYPPLVVYSQPPRPSGRGQRLQPSPVQEWAQQHGLTVRTPTSLKSVEEQEFWRQLRLDGAIIAAYGLLLPAAILDAPRHGCLNLHASLLPRWRGAAPIQRAMMAGDDETGITLMQMDVGLDTGAMLAVGRVPIAATDTGGSLHDRLADAAASLLIENLAPWLAGSLVATPQPEQGVCYAAKLTKSDQQLDWQQPAAVLARQVRAMAPRPGVSLPLGDGKLLKVLQVEAVTRSDQAAIKPGDWLADGLSLACGSDQDGRPTALRLITVQPAGKTAMTASDWRRGNPI
ncbi:MAG: methionyl-tRNA formyltransferase [Alphaproteobacteria bacterium]|nr:methionyl-tRNA formyltransferase [Alphaproteobacteria bacterium]